MSQNASCDPAEVVRIEAELAKKPNNLGVGVLDSLTGKVRLFTYDETDAFSLANPALQVMAGHEAAAVMAGYSPSESRGFVLAKQAGNWVVVNQSHMNRPDGQPNTMRMNPHVFDDIVAALQTAGVSNPVVR